MQSAETKSNHRNRARRRIERAVRTAFEALETRRLLANSIYAVPGADGHMLYQPQPLGDHIQDYSAAGYKGGTVPIPDVPIKVTISPVAGDDTANIQNAINTVAAMPLDNNGFRGAVYLNPGTYEVGTSISITTSGVVLRGAGPTQTVIHATGTGQRTIVQLNGSGTRSTVSGTTHKITDKYVPVGAISFSVDSTAGLSVGDTVIVHRPSTQQWINDMGMNLLDNPWTPGSKDINMDRTITHIDGNVITIDAPITQALDLKYTDASQGDNTIYEYTATGRISNVGIENIGGYSDFVAVAGDTTQTKNDEDHPWTFVNIDGAINAWARGIMSQYFGYSCVYVTGGSKWVTVEGSECLDPVSQVTGGRRYSFNIDDSSNVLFRNCYTREGRHDYVEGSTVVGPNVFVDDRADVVHADAGPHHRYSTEALWDNLTVGQLNIQDRGNSGTGHGHAGANMVVWNSNASSEFVVQSPIAAQNWLIGSIGTIKESTAGAVGYHTDGLKDLSGPAGTGQHVDTRSLYYQQLGERMAYEDFNLRETRLGDSDAFVNDGAADNVSVDPAWKTNIQTATGKTGVGFDSVGTSQLVPFTFNLNLDPGTYVVGAQLLIGAKSAGGSTANDAIYIEDKSRKYTWSQLGVASPGTNEGGMVIDLSKILAAMQDGKLNLAISGNTAVDWATLNFQTASTTEPTTTKLTAVADAYVNSASPTSNFGTGTTVQTDNDPTNGQLESFLKFDVSTITGVITRATIQMVPTTVTYGATGTGTFGSGIGAIYNTLSSVSNDSWTETGLNWNNKPAADPALDTYISSANAPLNFDVTALVRAAQAGDKTLSLKLASIVALADASRGNISYASRENSNATLRPQLVITTYNGLTPVADGLVRDGSSANTNFGTTTDLAVQNSTTSGNSRESYLKFDLTSVATAPAGATVRLMPINLGASNIQNNAAFVATDTWTEGGITWNTKPASSTTLGAWTPQQSSAGMFDVTSQVASNVGGSDKLLSLRVYSAATSSGVNQYASREHENGWWSPLLVLKNLAPMITVIPTINGSVNTPTPATWFGVWDAETPLASLSVTASSSNTTLLPNANISLSGSGADRFFTLTPAANQSGSSNVTITVTDAQGAQAVYTFLYVISNALVVNGDQDSPNENDVIRIVRNGTFVDIFRNDTINPVVHTDYASLASLTVNALGGNDQITIDYTNGDPIPAGGFTLDGGSGADTLSIAGSNAAATSLNMTLAGSGTMSMGAASALPSLTDLTLNSGETLNLNGQNQTIDSFSGDGTVVNNVASNTSTLTVGQQGGDGVFTGALQNGTGTLALTKAGGGVLVLNGNNSYSGSTFINGGTIESGNAQSLALLSGAVFFNGGTFHVTADMTSANVSVKYSTSFTGATSSSTGAFNVDPGVMLTIGTAGGNASLRTNGGGAHGGVFTKSGGGTLRILSANGQQDDIFHLDQGTIIAEAATALGGGDSGVRLDMKDGTTLVLRQDTSTNFATPIRSADANGQISVVVDRATAGAGVTHSLNALTSAGAFTLDVSTGSNITGGTAGLVLTNGVTLSGDGTFAVNNGASAATVLTAGPITGAFSMDKNDNGTMVLTGTNTYTGSTTIENGTLQLGTSGVLPTGTNLVLGADTDAGTLDLNGHSASVNSIVVTDDNATGNRILNLSAGQTLSVTGVSGSNAILVGGLSGVDNVNTKLTISGGGTLAVTSTAGNISIDNDAVNSSSTHTATLDLSGLGAFTADVAALNIGVSPTNQPRARGVLTLAGSNTITANSITIGKTLGNAGGGSALNLGQTNVIHANSFITATGKGNSASIAFRSGLVSPSVTIADKNTGLGADFYLGYKSNTGTASPVGTADFSAGSINATFHDLVLGWQADNSGNTATGTFTMSAGSVTAATLTVGRAQGTSSIANGTVNIAGGSLAVAGVSALGKVDSGATSTGTLNLTGGAVTFNSDITDGGGTSTLNLGGASLDLTGHAIGSGSGAAAINALTFTNGTLANVAQINGGATGVTKTAAGALTFAGTIGYTGATSVTGGTLLLNANLITSPAVSVSGVGSLLKFGAGQNRVLKTSNLTISSSGKVDLNEGKIILSGGIVGMWNGSAYTGVTGLVAAGSNGGAWNGSGIVTSQSAANNGDTLTTIGVALADDVGYAGGTFGGVAVSSGDVLVMYTYSGDANLDGQITGDDYFQIDSAFPQGAHGWLNGDFNYDGIVNGDDYFLIDSTFPAQGPPILV